MKDVPVGVESYPFIPAEVDAFYLFLRIGKIPVHIPARILGICDDEIRPPEDTP